MNNDTFDRFYNEFKDWSKEDILRRTYNIILDDADKTRQIEQLKNIIKEAIEYIEKSMNNTQPFYQYLFGDENGKVENLDKLLNILNKGSDKEWAKK